MKAYLISTKYEPSFVAVIFALNAGKAKSIALDLDGFEDESFTDIRVRRLPIADGQFRGHTEMDWYNEQDRIFLVQLSKMLRKRILRRVSRLLTRYGTRSRIARERFG